jgi:hypothetical protein
VSGPPDAAAILASLAPRSGLSLGALQSGRFDAFRVLLACAASSFAMDADYTERDVNDALRHWLQGAGAMLATDHVELRRWLVDTELLERDGYGRRYRRTVAPTDAYAEALRAVAGIDSARIVADARRDDAARRAARRAAHVGPTGRTT